MRKLFLGLLAMMMVTLVSVAQNREITGIVTNAEDGEPLIGASVVPVGTANGVLTDIEGRYSIIVSSDVKTLAFTYVGMVAKEMNIPAGSNMLNVALTPQDNMLDELVVTGYGVQRRAAFTGAASVVDGAKIENKNDMNLVKALEGVVPGIQYNNSTSMPGAYGSIYIRGMGSLSSSAAPLYIVDGVPVNSDYDNMSSSNNNYFDPMAAYNPADIESVTVLKDAAATSIYGARAANGVIVITTKKGGEGKFNLNFEMKQGFSSVANNNMKYTNAEGFLKLFATARTNANGKPYDENYKYLRDDAFGWDGVTDTDWFDVVTRKGYFQEYNISFNGTSGSTNYYASVGYTDAEGIVIGSSNERYSGRLNLDTSYKYFQAGVNASISWSKFGAFSQSTSGSMTNPTVGAATQLTPFDKVYNEDGSYANVNYYNPLAVWDKHLGDLNDQTNQTFNGNPWLMVKLPYGIWAKTSLGVNLVDQNQYTYWSAVYNPQGMKYNGLGQTYISRKSTVTWTNTFGWNYTFGGKHKVDLLLGQECQRYDYHYDYHSRSDFPFAASGMRDMTTAASDNGSEYYREESRLASYFGDAHYSYSDLYYLSASVRRDGSSVFGADKRWGTFWSVGGKWRISQEKFMQDLKWLTNLALRVSYGTVGNQSLPSLYAARGYYATGYNYMQAPGIVPVQISNDELTWETSKKFDIGFDLSLFNRVNVTFDYYNDTTSDALYTVPISMTTGMNSYYKNIGKILNRGIEVAANGTVFSNKDITVSVNANLGWNKNKVLKLADGSIEGTYSIIEEGHPYRQFYTREYAGVDRETGEALYYLNAEGDETTTNYNAAAKRYVGSAEPKVIGGFGVVASGYGFDFSMSFNFRLGSKVLDGGHNFTGWCTNAYRTPLQEYVDNFWTPENKDAKYPAPVLNDPKQVSNGNYSTRWLYNGSYLRLSNITFGYTLPKALTRKALLNKVRLFINLDNVHTWTASDFIGFNPDTYSSGYIAWQYPAAFTFTGGLQLSF